MLKTLGAQIREFKKDSLLTPVFMILEVFMETIIPLMMASIIDQGVEAGNIHHIYVMGAWMVVAACFSLFCGVMGGKYGARASAGFARNLRKAMYENIQSFSFSNIDKFSTAGLVTRLTTDVTNLQNAYQMLLRMCVRAPISLICAMCMAFFIRPRLASIYLVAVIILGIILAIITVRAHHYFMEVFPKYDDLNASVQENVSAIRVVKAYVREDYEKNKFRKASQNIYNMFVKAESILAFNNPVMQITVYSCILSISWVGAKMIVGGTLTTGELMSLLTYCMNIMMSLMMLSMVFVMLAMSVASAERICEVLNEKSDITNPENADKTVPDGSITFDHVTFRYEGAAEAALKDITLSVKKGQRAAIIGGTGSGKSTLVQLLLGFRMPTSGEVRMDGMPTQTLSRRTMRDNISCVLQNATIYSGTIRDNVRMGRLEAGDVEIREALEIAQAGEFVNGFSDGIDHMIRQSGKNLSGGQKQRLSIARALLKNAPIYIFDDSFSALDFLTEAKLRATLNRNLAGKTQLIITQRVTSAMHCDVIFVMDGGALVDSGTHAQLLERCGVYREIYASQTGGNLNA